MNTGIFDLVIEYPLVFVGELIFAALPGTFLAYGVVWLTMRPKNGEKLRSPVWFWHLLGLVSTLFGTAILRFLAMLTFAGRSALEPPTETGEAGLYILLLPAFVAIIYINWLKSKCLTGAR